MNILAIVVATIAAFIVSTIYYIIFGEARAELLGQELSDEMPAFGTILGELTRTFLLGCVVAYLVVRLGIATFKGGLGLGILLWVGFPVTLLWGSVMWDAVPTQLALIHSGDWLIKLGLISVIVALWRKK